MEDDGPARKKARIALEPRSYQLDVFGKASKENIIVYLETGTGKTHIAIMLINEFEEKLSRPNDNRIAVFLAPTVHLVIQQAAVVSKNTSFKVGVYYGDKGVDTWDIPRWKREVESHQVFVMTPKVFLDALSTSAIKLEAVVLLIIDECHHAQGNHPYSLIMKTHYHVPGLQSKPRIFGMTASPLIKKGVSSNANYLTQISELENLLDAKLYTLEDRGEVELFAPTPVQHVEYFDKSYHDFSELKLWLVQLKNEVELSERGKRRKVLSRVFTSVEYCLTELGLVPAILAVKVLLKQKSQVCCWEPEISAEEKETRKHTRDRLLNGMLSILNEALNGGLEKPRTIEAMHLAQREGQFTPKVLLLLKLLDNYRNAENMRCIVFVERVIASLVLSKLIRDLEFLSHVSCDFLTGARDWASRTTTEQQHVIDMFADGKVNLLIATSVAEEGLDMQKCSAVIRFDPCPTLRSHVQSRGRARRPASSFIWLLERGNSAQANLRLQFLKSEKVIKEQVVTRASKNISRDVPPQGDMEVFRVESGACRSTEDSVSFIHKFCARLPGDSYYTPRPSFSLRMKDSEFICTVKLPPNAPLQQVEGPPRHSAEIAKKIACLTACQRLLDIGAIRSDTLCPDKYIDEEEQAMPKDPSGKPRELCSSASLAPFRARWIQSVGVQLHAYKLSFGAEDERRVYAKFAFLIECALDAELACFEMVLNEKSGPVKAKLSALEQLELDTYELDAAKAYHELLFNGAFRRLVGFETSTSVHWDELQSYLLLPLNRNDCIDWLSVYSAAEASRILSGADLDLTLKQGGFPDSSGRLHTAGGSFPASSLLNSVVVSVHTRRLFCVTGVLEHLTAESQMCGNEKTSYVEYFKSIYKKLLCYPKQPLLQVKQTHGFHNLLVSNTRGKKCKISRDLLVSSTRDDGETCKIKSLVELPPELCLRTGLSSTVISSLYLVPSFMHRFHGLNAASQLRANIFPSCKWISATKILEALTSKKCREDFSLENLELLGDSFLKFCVTQRLFLCHSNKHEGQLTLRRSRATCNATLNRLAKSIGIPEYIQDELFVPSQWIAPGMYVVEDMLCRHDLTKLISSDKEATTLGPKCINGHRWLRWKLLADVVEALIGAHLVHGGFDSAMEFMSLIGIEVTFDPSLIETARQGSLPSAAVVDPSCFQALEKELHYTFQNKRLLVEAVTHGSEPDTNMCYQRLEFLGDGVLDFLVTRHLYETYPGLTPGVLTDMRSAEVNNNCFARVAVKHGLHRYLRHGSEDLQAKIFEYVQAVQDVQAPPFGFQGPEAPKQLGDLLESLAGAVFVDSGFDLDKLWNVVRPLLEPLVSPERVTLEPTRELRQLGGVFDWDVETLVATARLTHGEKTFVETSGKGNKRQAKKDAAQKVLAKLKEKDGISHAPSMKQIPVQENRSPELRPTDFCALSADNDGENGHSSSARTHGLSSASACLSGGSVLPASKGFTSASTADQPGTFRSKETHGISASACLSRAPRAPVLPDGCLLPAEQVQSYVEHMVYEALKKIAVSTAAAHDQATLPVSTAKHDAHDRATLNVSTAEHAVHDRVTLPDSIASQINHPGGPRQFLHELCTKKRWGRPVFETESTGESHLMSFTCSVTVMLPDDCKLQETGSSMREKRKAMDDASRNMIRRLFALRLLS